jgi:hypothetical protein
MGKEYSIVVNVCVWVAEGGRERGSPSRPARWLARGWDPVPNHCTVLYCTLQLYNSSCEKLQSLRSSVTVVQADAM